MNKPTSEKSRFGNSVRLLTAALLVTFSSFAAEKTVTVEGFGVGRDQALANALREAVRQVAGTDLVSETKTKNFALAYDEVFTRSLGFVKTYEVLEQNSEYQQGYFVKIKATVSDSDEFTSDQQIISMLIRRKRSPRIAIKGSAKLQNVQGDLDAAAVLREMALAYGLKLVDLPTVEKQAKGGGPLPYDCMIDITVFGAYKGETDVYGTAMSSFETSATVKAVWADTGEVIATVNLPGATVATTVGSNAGGARDCLVRMLQGKIPDTKGASAHQLFRRVFLHWVTELDLGRQIDVTLKQIDREAFDKLSKDLRQVQGIGQVYYRGFDRKQTSKLEVESRLPAPDLAKEIEKILPGYVLNQLTSGAVDFEPLTGAKVAATTKRIINDATTSIKPTDKAMWPWIALGSGVILLVLGTGMLIKRVRP